jgi:hypothetical protein
MAAGSRRACASGTKTGDDKLFLSLLDDVASSSELFDKQDFFFGEQSPHPHSLRAHFDRDDIAC